MAMIPPRTAAFQAYAVHRASCGKRSGVSMTRGSTYSMEAIRPLESNPNATPLTWAGRRRPNVSQPVSPRKVGCRNLIASRNPIVAKTGNQPSTVTVSYTHLRAHETDSYLVCRLLLE